MKTQWKGWMLFGRYENFGPFTGTFRTSRKECIEQRCGLAQDPRRVTITLGKEAAHAD